MLQSVLAGCLVAGSLCAQQPASATGGPRPGVDVLQYDFRVEFPASSFPDVVRFAATTTAVRRGATGSLALDLVAALQVDSVHVNAVATPFTRPGDSVRVALPRGQDDTVRVAVFYHGLPTDGLIVRRDSTLGWTAFGDNFPNRARQWLAVVDHPADKALVHWDVLAPATHRVIANGRLVEETPDGATGDRRRVRTRWQGIRPIYTAVMVIGVAPFAVVELADTTCVRGEVTGCVRQSVWTSPANRAVVPGNFARAAEMVALFTRLAGPFPYEKLAHVASSTRYGGMENAAAIFYADNLFRPGSPSEGLIAHETAHQWFGDAVTEREWPDVWLSEGFATYFAALWSEHAHGSADFRREMTEMRAEMLASPITVEKPVIDTGLDDLGRVLNTNVYQKAGFVLHMLRREIGDSAFFGGIRSYYGAYRHRNASTDDLRAEFEKAAGRELGWFFAQWMQRPGFADIRPTWRWDASRGKLVASVVQGARFTPYRLSLSIDVTDAAGVTQRTRILVPAQASSTIDVPLSLSAAPRRVEFDPDVSILGTVATPAGAVRAPAIGLQGITGHWTEPRDGGEMVVDGTKWNGTTADSTLTRASRELFGVVNDTLVKQWNTPNAFPVAVVRGNRDFRNGLLRVQFRMLAGASDQNAGIVFNLQPNGEYLYLRYNTKDGDLALWKFSNGQRSVIAHGEAGTRIPLDQWATLEVRVDGNRVTGTVPGYERLRLEQQLEAPATGRVGLWVKRDAVTAFRDFTIAPRR
ncbi:MAG: M1 family aminopeptidase [Gemmatimonadota bacterium]